MTLSNFGVHYKIQSELCRAMVLSGLAPYLPESMLCEALELMRAIQNESDRAIAMSGLAPQIDLKLLDFPLWKEILHSLSHHHRKSFLADIPNLAPAIIELSDRSALPLVAEAINDVCHQWP